MQNQYSPKYINDSLAALRTAALSPLTASMPFAALVHPAHQSLQDVLSSVTLVHPAHRSLQDVLSSVTLVHPAHRPAELRAHGLPLRGEKYTSEYVPVFPLPVLSEITNPQPGPGKTGLGAGPGNARDNLLIYEVFSARKYGYNPTNNNHNKIYSLLSDRTSPRGID